MILLVVLGHKNNPDGDLYPTAENRCSRAAEVIKEKSIKHILVTGAFGKDFNISDAPHSSRMISVMKKKLGDSLANGIKFHQSATAYTEEDILAARRIAVDLNANEVIFLTSEFHMPRVKLIAKTVFRDWTAEISFIQALNGPDIFARDEKEETEKRRKFDRDWVDVPLYSKKDEEFPESAYRNALEDHMHADTISLSILTASLVIAAYPHTNLAYENPDLNSVLKLLACSIISGLLFTLYLRFATFAGIGRRVMRAIELSWGKSGFSYNYEKFHCDERERLKTGSVKEKIEVLLSGGIGTIRTLKFIMVVIIAVNLIIIYFFFFGWSYVIPG